MLDKSFVCKTCGASLDEFVAKSTDGLVTCKYCQNVWTVPRKSTNPAALEFLRIGEHDLDIGRFDEAIEAYHKAAEHDSDEPEAYFGIALAEFKVRYLKDNVNNKMQPICYEVTEKKFTKSNAYKYALELATPKQREEYKRKGAEIDYILEEFLKLKNSGVTYDCFICVKVTNDVTKQPTEDSKDADYIYRLLQDKGYKPFYSERELHNVTGADYEARILYALYTSECMLVVCRNESYLQTPWVKNEYSRFLKLVNDEEKESDSISIVFNEAPIEKLPGREGKLQGIDFAKRSADGQIIDFVSTHTPEARKKRQAAIDERRYAEAEREKRERALEEQQRQLTKKIEALNKGQHSTIENLLTRAWQELEARDFVKAERFFETVLEAAPENEEAWRGKFLCSFNVTTESAITVNEQNAENIIVDKNLNNYLKYRTDNTHDKLYNDLLVHARSTLERTKENENYEVNAKRKQLNKREKELKIIKHKINLISAVPAIKIIIPILIIIIVETILFFKRVMDFGLLYLPAIGMAILFFGAPFLIRLIFMDGEPFPWNEWLKDKKEEIKEEQEKIPDIIEDLKDNIETLTQEILNTQFVIENCDNLINCYFK